MTRSHLRRTGIAAVAALVLILLALPASAQEAPVDVKIREATLDDDGTTEILVSVTGSAVTDRLAASAFTVTEDGEAVNDIAVTPLQEAEDPVQRSAMVLFDVSGSTAGEPLEAAKTAATDFVSDVTASGVSVGLVTFSDTAQLVVPPTREAQAVTSAIEGLEATGETAFYDAVLVAARALQNLDGQHTIVAFTDGADTVSGATLDAAINAAETVAAPVSSVALTTGDLDLAPLQALSEASGGDVVEASEVAALETAFAQVARDLTSQYVISYTGGVATGEFDLSVEVAIGDAVGSDRVTLLSPRDGRTPTEPRPVTLPSAGVFSSPTVLWASLGGLFVALLLLFVLLFVPRGDRRVSRTLSRGMRIYGRREPGSRRGGQIEFSATAFGRRAVELVERLPKPEGYDEKLQLRLDRASWPLRASEFTALRFVAVILGVIVGWGLLGAWVLAVVLAVVGWLVPSVVLDQRVAARRRAFLEQLPSTLQLLAGSLKAGYGILQAIDTVVKEADQPTASEFQRVLTEARLGMALEDSLDAMADRIGSEDFRWVAVAINIQRRVGGNLAELLDTVAATLRERESVRRQIQTLSAEGRLSAVVLTLLPIALALYLLVVNPSYIGTLFQRTVGQMMVGGAVVLMVVGVFWMRRMIDIDV